ncbi:MAG TPA: hypothetical protein VFY17_05080 [Pilimelia sp.]|nr:hypothetical protein [Pilimelia sp.]
MSDIPSPDRPVALPPAQWRDIFVAELQQRGVRAERISAALAEVDARHRAAAAAPGPLEDPRVAARDAYAALRPADLVPVAAHAAATAAVAALGVPAVLLLVGAARALAGDTRAVVTVGLAVAALGAVGGAAAGTVCSRRLGGRAGGLPVALALLCAVPPYLLLDQTMVVAGPVPVLLAGLAPFAVTAVLTVAPQLVYGRVRDPRTGSPLRPSPATARQRWSAVAALVLVVLVAYAVAAAER